MISIKHGTSTPAATGLTAFVALTLAAVTIAGCGKSDSSPTTPASTPDKSQPAPAKAGANWPAKLRVSAIPDVNPDRLQTQYRPYAERLARELGIEVEFTPVTDYPTCVVGIAADQLDLVWFGGYTSVQAMRECKGEAERIAMRAEDAQFRSVFIASVDSGIATLADLKGKTFAFGSESSTSGHLMPRHFLSKEGLDPEKDFGDISFSGAHDATVKFVEEGKVQAGTLNILVWQRLEKEGKVDANKVKVFWTTPPYVDYCWVASKRLPADLRARIKQVFLSLDPAVAADKALLDLHNATRYIEARDEDWKGIEDAARGAGMLKD